MSAPIALIRLTRPHNAALAAVAVAVGAVTGPDPVTRWAPVVWAALAACLITGGGNTLNDVVDVEVDSINKPHRPLPSGLVTRREATVWAVLLMLAGFILTMQLPPGCMIVAVTALLLIPLYDLWGSARPLVGNFMVSILTCLAFVFGSLAAGHGWWGLIPGVFAFFFDLGREIIKDLEDMEADRQGGLRTWPLVAGEASARRLAQAALVVLLLVLPVPVIAGWLGYAYLGVVVAGVAVPIFVMILKLSSELDVSLYRRFQLVLKWDMLVGMLAVLAG